MTNRIAMLSAVFCTAVWAQAPAFDFKSLDKLAKNAKETSTISLDENTLKAGASFFGAGDPDAQQLKDVIKGIRGMVIRSFEYDKDGMYNPADLEPVRAYFRGLNWSKIVDVKSTEESAEIYLSVPSEGKVGGLAIITSEPKEVSVIYISGSISLDKIGALSGKMGIPDFNISDAGSNAKPKDNRPKDGKKPAKDDDEKDDEKDDENLK